MFLVRKQKKIKANVMTLTFPKCLGKVQKKTSQKSDESLKEVSTKKEQ